MSKLSKYIHALNTVTKAPNMNSRLRMDLLELRDRIQRGILTWREGCGGRDEYKPKKPTEGI